MPNSIGVGGLTTSTQAELVAQYTADMESIYGTDINLEPDTPDAQQMMIFIQVILDTLDLLTNIYNMMDPDNAVGAVLDQRVALNGIQRQAGTYTVTNITITVDQACTLLGLDDVDEEEAYTVQDNAGNEFVLTLTQTPSGAGSAAYAFRAKVPGRVLTTPNTITSPVTIVLGVTTINNPTTYTTLGIDEETDADLKLRRQKSVQLASQGFRSGLLAALENINGVASAFVYENVTGSTDGDGVPSHSIWVIVSGTAAAEDIANAIYTKRNAGCGMFGDVTYNITQSDGSVFIVRWDIVEAETLYIKFDASSLDGVNVPNVAAIKEGLLTTFVPGVYGQININDLATAVQEIDNNCLVTNAGFSVVSNTGPWSNVLSPSAKNKQFAIIEANIDITVV